MAFLFLYSFGSSASVMETSSTTFSPAPVLLRLDERAARVDVPAAAIVRCCCGSGGGGGGGGEK